MEWYILAILSAFFSAIAAILEKKALFKSDPLIFSFLLSSINLMFSFLLLPYVSFDALNMYSLSILFIKSVLGSFSFLFIMKGLKKLDISASLPLLVLTPGLVAIFAFIFLNEKLSSFEMVGLSLLLIGTYFLQKGSFSGWYEPLIILFKKNAYGYLLIALGIFTLTSLLDKVLVGNYKVPPITFLFMQHIFTFLSFLFIFLISRKKAGELKIPFGLTKLIVLISVATIAYRYLQIEAVKAGPVALVLGFKRFSVFFAAMIGGSIFREKKLLTKGVAIAIMLIGVFIIITYK